MRRGWTPWLLGAITIAFAALRLPRLLQSPAFNLAEIQEIFNARCGAALSNLGDAGTDFLGFFWNNQVWRFGLEPMEAWGRVPGFLAGCALPAAVWWLARSLSARRGEALLAAGLVAASFLVLEEALTARQYVLLALGYALAVGGWVRWRTGGGAGAAAALLIGSTLALTTHTLGFCLLPLLVLSWRGAEPADGARSGSPWLLAGLLPGVALGTWFFLVFWDRFQVHKEVFTDISELGVGELGRVLLALLTALGGAGLPINLLLGGVIAAGLYASRNRPGFLTLAAWLPGALLGFTFLSWMSGHALNASFLIILAPPTALLAARGLILLRQEAAARFGARIGLAAVVVCLVLLALPGPIQAVREMQRPYRITQAIDAREAAKLLDGMGEETVLIYRYEEGLGALFMYAAYELDDLRLATRAFPPTDHPLALPYTHRLSGCADRPRVDPARVHLIPDLTEGDLTGVRRVVIWMPERALRDRPGVPALVRWLEGGAAATPALTGPPPTGWTTHEVPGATLLIANTPPGTALARIQQGDRLLNLGR